MNFITDRRTYSLRCNASCLLRDRDIRKIIFICYQMGSRDGVSELVRNTADNTLGHMVLQMNGVWQRCSPVGKGTLELLMLFLTDLSNPRHKSDSTCILAMCLINIALERGNQSPRLRSALAITSQHDLCRHLLEASRTVNLAILSLISRVRNCVLRRRAANAPIYGSPLNRPSQNGPQCPAVRPPIIIQ